MNHTNSHTACLICGSGDIRHMKGYDSPVLVKCADCSFVFAQEIPSQQELMEYYSSDYDRTSYFSPITAVRYMQLLEAFEPFRKTNKLLDVGCGYGFFLEIAKKKGWDVYGVEYSSDAVEQCRKIGATMYQGDLKDAPFENETFDVIVSIEVLEHLNNPVPHVKHLYELLRHGGTYYMSTPNFNSLLRFRLKANYDVIGYPNHLCYYTPKTLTKLFTENDFTKVKLKTTGISLTRIRTSKGKSNQKYVSETSDDEMMRYRIEKNGLLRAARNCTNWFLNATKLGDSMKAQFIKK